MSDDELLNLKCKSAIIAHVEMMQGIINRMAGYSAKCKEWCVTLVGALIAYIFGTGKTEIIDSHILYYIIGIFCLVDAYYLGLERNHKKHLKEFIKALREKGSAIADDVFLPYGTGSSDSCWYDRIIIQLFGIFCSFNSLSILLPYGLLFLVTKLVTS